ncbi:hypothetical protein F7Q99_13610 [Streptomyces kaniharaensis]|uniref:Uncharacterized protein n=1 Tax=Streptomyces kaniharaensis TaxID=212423 RepID=A0A6N7KPD7_9ACTN|nr:hypothetical protein [Streptomyces kaniharaensis]MQS13291.1 hypothetical protein [Streptomyces kaniharaensis]
MSEWPAVEATIDQLDAAARCETLLQDTVDAISPAPVWRSALPREGTRLPLPGEGVDPRWYVTRGRDFLTIVSEARRGALVGAVGGYWRRRGWTITSVNAGRRLPGVAAETPDGYQLALHVGDLGEVGLTASSPGAARSERLPYVQGVAGCGRPSLPHVCCPYWSAMA